ncbi:hypothetical protein ERO13_D02G052532v2, partial [Gossypium hirsutum]
TECTDHLFFKCKFIDGFWLRIFHWWGVKWKFVACFVKFFSLCFNVKLTAAYWTVWLARNDKIYDRTSTTLNTLLFHSKMRSLMWAGAVHDDIQFMERSWWYCLVKCRSSK